MTSAGTSTPPVRAARLEDPHGWAVGILAVVLAVGTALPLLGQDGKAFPPPPDLTADDPSPPSESPATARDTPGAPRPATGGTKRPVPFPLDLNAADAAALQGLPGIGPSLAGRIVAYREAHGPFRGPEDLLHVPGIGPKRWERVRSLIRVDQAP